MDATEDRKRFQSATTQQPASWQKSYERFRKLGLSPEQAKLKATSIPNLLGGVKPK